MSQFVMVRAVEDIGAPAGIVLCEIDAHDEFLGAVAREYFATADACRLVVDVSGAAESFMNSAWEARGTGGRVEETAFARFACSLIEIGAEFICWAGADYLDLPVVSSWAGFVEQLKVQTAQQPADCWIHFRPEINSDPDEISDD